MVTTSCQIRGQTFLTTTGLWSFDVEARPTGTQIVGVGPEVEVVIVPYKDSWTPTSTKIHYEIEVTGDRAGVSTE